MHLFNARDWRVSERSSRWSAGSSKQQKEELLPAPARMDAANWDGASSRSRYTFIAFVVDFVVVGTYFTVSPGSCLS